MNHTEKFCFNPTTQELLERMSIPFAIYQYIDKRVVTQPPFAIVIFDVNDLKKVNDTTGHQAGDQYLRDASNVICEVFKHSPVFRVGGDEFAVIAQGNDYARVEELLNKMKKHNLEAMRSGGIVIACGMAKFENDLCVTQVFDRADKNMYENKSSLKEGDHPKAPESHH